MRRQHTHHQDPDVEAIQVEREQVEGQKNALQTEVLGIAQNKKDLEQKFEEATIRLDDEFQAKKTKYKKELAVLESLIATLTKKKNTVLVETEQVVSDLARLVAEQKKQQAVLDTMFENHRKVVITHNELLKKVAQLEVSCSDLGKLLVDKEEKVKSINQQITTVTKNLSTLQTTHQEGSTKYADLVAQIELLTGQKTTLGEEVVEARKATTEALAAAEKARGELGEVNREMESSKKEMQSRLDKINERAGDLAHLEVRVNEKIEILKEAKREFTTEHLLRLGIKD